MKKVILIIVSLMTLSSCGNFFGFPTEGTDPVTGESVISLGYIQVCHKGICTPKYEVYE